MELKFTPEALADLEYWKQSGDKRAMKKINELLLSIQADYKNGKGQPEQLKQNFSGYWSRRIDKKNRLVYYPFEDDQIIVILSAKGHYFDK